MKSIFTCFFKKQKTLPVPPVPVSLDMQNDKENTNPNITQNSINTTVEQIKPKTHRQQSNVAFDYNKLNIAQHSKLGIVFQYNTEINCTVLELEKKIKISSTALSSIGLANRDEQFHKIRETVSTLNLKTETLYLAFSLFDQYISNTKNKVVTQKLQILTLACIFISCKYQQIYPPSLNKLAQAHKISISNRKFLLDMENQILMLLNFELSGPTVYYFLDKFNSFLQIKDKKKAMSEYIAELFLMNVDYAVYSHSVIALSAIYLSCCIFKEENMVKALAVKVMGQDLQIKECAKKMVLFTKDHKYSMINQKYSSGKYFEVGKMKLR